MLKIITSIWIVFTSTLSSLLAAEETKSFFDKKVTVYVHVKGNAFTKRMAREIELSTVNQKLLEILKKKAIEKENLIDRLMKDGVHVTPQERVGYYQATVELKNSITGNYITFEYDFCKNRLHLDKELKKSEEGRLMLDFFKKNELFRKKTLKKSKGVSPII